MQNLFYDLLCEGNSPESIADAMNEALRAYEENKAMEAEKQLREMAAEDLANAFNAYFEVCHPDVDWKPMDAKEAAEACEMLAVVMDVTNAIVDVFLAEPTPAPKKCAKPTVAVDNADPLMKFFEEMGF
jgi:predicted Zn-dependent protease